MEISLTYKGFRVTRELNPSIDPSRCMLVAEREVLTALTRDGMLRNMMIEAVRGQAEESERIFRELSSRSPNER